MWRCPICGLDASAGSRALLIVSLLATILALVQLSRVSIFMVDASQLRCSVFPSSEWERNHSCSSAYFVAAHAIDHVPNVYDDAVYSVPNADPAAASARHAVAGDQPSAHAAADVHRGSGLVVLRFVTDGLLQHLGAVQLGQDGWFWPQDRHHGRERRPQR